MEAFPARRGHYKAQRTIALTQTAARRTFRHTVQYAPVLPDWIGLGPLTTPSRQRPFRGRRFALDAVEVSRQGSTAGLSRMAEKLSQFRCFAGCSADDIVG